MQYPPQISIDSLIMHLIDTLIHWIEIIPSWIGNGVPYGHLFAEDLRQLHATRNSGCIYAPVHSILGPTKPGKPTSSSY